MPAKQRDPNVNFLTLPQTAENFDLYDTGNVFFATRLGEFHDSIIWHRAITVLEQKLKPNYWTESHVDYSLEVIVALLKQDSLSTGAYIMKPRQFKWLLDKMTATGLARAEKVLKKDVLHGDSTFLLSCLNLGNHWITIVIAFGESSFIGIFDSLSDRNKTCFLPE